MWFLKIVTVSMSEVEYHKENCPRFMETFLLSFVPLVTLNSGETLMYRFNRDEITTKPVETVPSVTMETFEIQSFTSEKRERLTGL